MLSMALVLKRKRKSKSGEKCAVDSKPKLTSVTWLQAVQQGHSKPVTKPVH